MSFNDTNIIWCDKTWNPVSGCSKTSEGCKNCYAEAVSTRFGHTDKPWTTQNAEENIQLKEWYLDDRLSEPAWVFVNSMSDLFHPLVSDSFIKKVYDAIRDMPESCFLILTKHGADNKRDIPTPPENVILGVSVENDRRKYRIHWLREQDATTKFVSFEPLIGKIPSVYLSDIDWAIIGGESGQNHREMNPEWARRLIHSCYSQGVSVLFKQHSGRYPEARTKIEFGLRETHIREFPEVPNGVVPTPKEFLKSEVTP